MQKIVIKNFGPIAEAEIKLQKSVVLIGEQASGKSTIAKLIYYFKSLKEDLFNNIYTQSLKTGRFDFDYTQSLIIPARKKFYDFFGSTRHLRDFEITFFYDTDKEKYLRLILNENKNLHLNFSNNFYLNKLGAQIRGIRDLLPMNINEGIPSEILAFNQEKLKYAERLSELLRNTFCCEQDDHLFVVSGRNATVGYSESFEQQFLSNARHQYEESYKKRQQTIDETLMLAFMDRVVDMKGMFKKFGDFEHYSNIIESIEQSDLKSVVDKINDILKGKYRIDTFGEKIEFNPETKEHIYLSNASSGQQEVIRILQDIFLSIAQGRNILRIVEEPEAHLFPLAQKNVVELLVRMVKKNEGSQLIITTHSPYVLTVFNNLLFAQRVVDKNPESENDVSKIIEKEVRLNSFDFSAYALGKNDGRIVATSIVDDNTGLIEQNYLDTISEILANEFNMLYAIHAKTFKRQ